MTVNQLNQTAQGEFEQLYTMKSTASDRTQLNLRHAISLTLGQWYSLSTPVFTNNKTYCLDNDCNITKPNKNVF
jgi:hypothetical protein